MNSLGANVIRFGRVLHSLGVRGAAGRNAEALRALQFVDVGRRDDFYYTLRALLVNRVDDLELFDRAFRAFWRPEGKVEAPVDVRPIGQDIRIGKPLVEMWSLQAGTMEPDAAGETTPERVDLATYSASEILRKMDFARMSAEELSQAEALAATIDWDPGLRVSRRWHSAPGRTPDLRGVLRKTLRNHGEWPAIPTRSRKTKLRPLVLLCDISGSMERYTRMLLRFAHMLSGNFSRLEAFVFSTRLTRITLPLRRNKIDRALREIAGAVKDWGGGTRTGEALHQLHVEWGRRVLIGGPAVLVVSDGWDCGDPRQLAREMARLHRACYRLVWLNPLLGSPVYEPLTRGMQAALPHIDDFLPVHNVASIEHLARHLQALPARGRR
jgi:uncharacterized protein